jgi:transposase InsO family protein
VDADLERALLSAKAQYPAWGAKKLVHILWGDAPPLCVRTADRILARNGLVGVRVPAEPPALERFERAEPNELWQMDFKGMSKPTLPYTPLSVLDDATRYGLGFDPVAEHTCQAVWERLWSLFERYGLPWAMLCDNEGCFASPKGLGPSKLETWLWRLGIKTLHGRPVHPQTQGKVERFHLTVKLELGQSLRQPTAEQAAAVYGAFLDRYNWERPHEAIDMKVPGELYTPSDRRRPETLPEAVILGEARKVDASGKFWYKGKRYRAGKGLQGQWIDIREDAVFYAQVQIGPMSELRV